jgi:hypothetical protein
MELLELVAASGYDDTVGMFLCPVEDQLRVRGLGLFTLWPSVLDLVVVVV